MSAGNSFSASATLSENRFSLISSLDNDAIGDEHRAGLRESGSGQESNSCLHRKPQALRCVPTKKRIHWAIQGLFANYRAIDPGVSRFRW